MNGPWAVDAPGVLALPSGRRVRGRALRRPLPPGASPDLGLYLSGAPKPVPWTALWLRWPDFWLPSDPDALLHALRQVWARSDVERVEIAVETPWQRRFVSRFQT